MKSYMEDLKNLKPKPLDKIPVTKTDFKTHIIENTINHCNSSVIINKSTNHKSESSMEKLTTSKTLWGFGIAILIYLMQNLLVAFNITSPDNLILKTFIEVVIAIAGFFGIYGVRDALRKMNL